MGIIDTHAHIITKDKIIEVNSNPNIECIINVGMNATTSSQIIEIAQANPKFYAACGVHPLCVYGNNNGSITYGRVNKVFELATSNKVVAIGEIGLDYNSGINKEYQRWAFINQINIANELGLPVIIRSSDDNDEMLDILKKVKPKFGCVFHLSELDFETITKITELGYYISFTGPIDIETGIDKDLLLVGTNSSSMTDINTDVVLETTKNAKRLFKRLEKK